jgi:hypothetical protein
LQGALPLLLLPLVLALAAALLLACLASPVGSRLAWQQRLAPVPL